MIAEVIGGVLLGPSVMGRIPGFKAAIFPEASMPALTLAANLGLVLFLFLVGLEVDLRYLMSNWRIAVSVGAAGMALPFGLGCAIAYGLYNEFRNEPGLAPIGFGVYMLFIGVAMAITAFPVLCRILTELKLLATPVGVIVLSAGVANDVIGWILLALCVALANSGTGLTALWVLLTAVGYTLFLVYAVRPSFLWTLRKTGSLQNGPTQSVVALTILLVLTSAFFTGVIGIHAIFGAFMIGLICPHEGGFAIKLTEKIEDLVSVLFLPLYFALSGLSTNLGLLDNGITWAYVIGIIAIAFIAKILGGTLGSRLNGLLWRESFTIGVLMSCKGLVELIVLNIGLQAKILSVRTFTIFVVMALVTTFATTPLTSLLYPVWYQQKLDLWKKGKIDWEGNPLLPHDTSTDRVGDTFELITYPAVRKVLVYLRLDGLASLFTLIMLLGDRSVGAASAAKGHHLTEGKEADKDNTRMARAVSSAHQPSRLLQVHGLRLIELTERDSSVMAVTENVEYATRDPIVKAFRTFGESNNVLAAGSLSVVPERSFAGTLLSRANDWSSDMILIPWSETGSMSEQPSFVMTKEGSDPLLNRPFASFVFETFETSSSMNMGVFIDRAILQSAMPTNTSNRRLTRTNTGGMSVYSGIEHRIATPSASEDGHHILVPFFGGSDDSFAMRLAVQLARNPNVAVTVIYFRRSSLASSASTSQANADRENDTVLFTSTRDSLPEPLSSRIVFEEFSSLKPHTSISVIARLKEALHAPKDGNGPMHIIIAGRSSSANVHNGSSMSGREDHRTLGMLNTSILEAMNSGDLHASLMVVQAKKEVEHGEDGTLKRTKSHVIEP